MKKNTIRIITVLLSLLMITSMTSVTFAAVVNANAGKSVKQYDHYLSIGDSVSGGLYCDEGDYFPSIVCEAVGATPTYFNHNGLRMIDTLTTLGEYYQGMNVEELYAADAYYRCGCSSPEMWVDPNIREQLEKGIKEADLITIELGINDVFYGPISISDPMGALSDGIPSAVSSVADFVSLTNKGYLSLRENYPKLLKKIFELKKGQDFDIVIIGIYTPTNFMRLSDTLDMPLGSISTGITAMTNAMLKETAKKFGCIYVDITNVETGDMASGDSLFGGAFATPVRGAKNTHPSITNGYEYIARQVIYALSENNAKADTNIRIDVGNVGTIKSVSVDGIQVSGSRYSYENSILTVRYPLITAKTLKLEFVRNGKRETTVYQLSYDLFKGYDAYILYNTTDTDRSVSNIKNNIKSVVTLPSTLIKSAFGK